MAETRVSPQDIDISRALEPTLTFNGMPWYDSTLDMLKFDTGGGTFEAAIPEHNPSTGEHGPRVNVTQTGNDRALSLSKTDLTSGEHCINITNEGNTGSRAINIDHRAGAPAVDIIRNTPAEGPNDPVMRIVEQQVGPNPASNQYVLGIGAFTSTAYMLGVGNPLNGIGANSPAGGINIWCQSNSNKFALAVRHDGAGSTYAAVINRTAGSGGGLTITNDGGGSGIIINENVNGHCLYMTKSHTGGSNAVRIDHYGTGKALYITNREEGTTASVIHVDSSSQGGSALEIDVNGTAGICNGILVEKHNAVGGNVFTLTDAGIGDTVSVTKSGTGRTLYIVQSNGANASPVLTLENAGTGYDIRGTGGNWYVEKNGDATFNDVTINDLTAADITVDTVTVNQTFSQQAIDDTHDIVFARTNNLWTTLGLTLPAKTFNGSQQIMLNYSVNARPYVYECWIELRIVMDAATVIPGTQRLLQIGGDGLSAWDAHWMVAAVSALYTPSAGSHTFTLQYRTNNAGNTTLARMGRRTLNMVPVIG